MACISDLYFKNHLLEKDMPEEILKKIKELFKESEK